MNGYWGIGALTGICKSSVLPILQTAVGLVASPTERVVSNLVQCGFVCILLHGLCLENSVHNLC